MDKTIYYFLTILCILGFLFSLWMYITGLQYNFIEAHVFALIIYVIGIIYSIHHIKKNP